MSTAISKKILRNTGWNLFSRLVHIPVSICLIPFIMDRVGAHWYGIWVAFFAFVDYFTLLDLGVGAATIRYVAEYHASHDIQKIGSVAVTTCGLNLLFLPPLVAAYACTDNVLDFFHIAPHDMEEARFLFHWVLLNFALSQFASVFRNILIGLQLIHVANLCEILYLFAYAGGTLAVLAGGGGLKGVAVMLFILRCGLSAAQLCCLHNAIPDWRRGLARFDLALLNDFFRYGLKLQLNSLAGLLNFQLDKLLIGHFLRMEFVALYEIGSKLAMVVRYVPSIFLSPLIPASAELAVHQDAARLEELYLRSTKYLTLIAAPLMAFLVSMGPMILQIWLGQPAHAYAVMALQLLSIGYFFNIIAGAALAIGRGMGVLTYESRATGLITVLNLVLSIVLVVKIGFVGALMGTASAMLAGNLIYILHFNRFIRIAGGSRLYSAVLKPLGSACLAGLLTYGAQSGLEEILRYTVMGRLELAWCLAGAGLLFATIFGVALWISKCFCRSDIEMIGQFLAAIRAVRC